MIQTSMNLGERHQNESAPKLQLEAEGANEKILFAGSNDITDEERERLSLRVKSTERDNAELIDVWLVPFARQCAAIGRYFSVGAECDRLSVGGVVPCDHNDHAILARIVAERVPSARPYMQLRKSKFDQIFKSGRQDV